MLKNKKPCKVSTAEENETAGVSTSYGGMTRVRFGGSFPRVGKSRLYGRERPCRVRETWRGMGNVPREKWLTAEKSTAFIF
jgi:hypothetical protein